ncbi:hypothetical protein DFH09DRAFT_1073220 [Mycena vulgaris]|nr:hypothetical protein DFH09DRAFT_1073220 [Mycena vulgaris]
MMLSLKMMTRIYGAPFPFSLQARRASCAFSGARTHLKYKIIHAIITPWTLWTNVTYLTRDYHEQAVFSYTSNWPSKNTFMGSVEKIARKCDGQVHQERNCASIGRCGHSWARNGSQLREREGDGGAGADASGGAGQVSLSTTSTGRFLAKVYHVNVKKLTILDKGDGGPWNPPSPDLPSAAPSAPSKRARDPLLIAPSL